MTGPRIVDWQVIGVCLGMALICGLVLPIDNTVAQEAATVTQEAAVEEAKSPKPQPAVAAVDPFGVPAASSPEARVCVYSLKYANAQTIIHLLQMVVPQSRVTIDSSNSMIVFGAPSDHERIAKLLQTLDVPAKEDMKQIKIFSIQNADVDSLAQALTGVLSQNDLKIAVDPRSNSIIAVGAENQLEIVEAIIMRLDETRDKDLQRQRAFQVRIVWLASGLSDEAPKPVPDLLKVVNELITVGVTGLRQVGQAIVNVASGSDFQIGCTPMLGDAPVDTQISGTLLEMGDLPRLEIEISNRQTFPPPPSDITDARRRVVQYVELAHLETEIVAPLGQYVVLGVTPAGKMTSVFVVQITPSTP